MRHAVRIEKRGRSIAALGAAVALVLGCTALCDAKTWKVTTTADSATNTGSLRYIVSNADGGDTIKFTSDGADLTSELKLDKKLTIEGPATIRQTAGSIWFLTIQEGKKITLKNLTLKGLVTDRYVSGIFNDGELSMKDCTVNAGGSIQNDGELDMEDCTLAGLTSGGVTNNGALEMDDCVIKDCVNRDRSFNYSGISNFSNAKATLKNCAISNNRTVSEGGGVMNYLGTVEMEKCSITGNHADDYGGGVYNVGKLTLKQCTVTGNSTSKTVGGGITSFSNAENTRIKDKSVIRDNTPEQITGPYKADDNCTIVTNPNRSATAFSGYSGATEPEPRSIVGDADVADVKSALADPASDLFAAVSDILSQDLGGISGDATASLYYANTFEGVAIESQDLFVEYTASYPERTRYYALFARADESGYELPDRGVQFELQPGQSLPDGVTPPDFYAEGEGLMTWRSVITDNGSYDLEPAVGVVTFRVCSVRAAEQAVGDKGSGGGCDAGASSGSLPLALLIALPLLHFTNPKRGLLKQRERSR